LSKAATNPPKHPSMCTPMSYFFPISASYSIGSTIPWGKLGYDPIIRIVFESIRDLRWFRST
jgi:hypothetical protein